MASTAPITARTAEIRAARRRVILLVYHHDGVEMVPMSAGVGVVVGREPPADVVVRDRSLSRRHARFTLVGGDVMIEDLGSRNGTQLNGQRVERGVVKPGEEVLLGTLVASIHALSGGEMPPLGLEGSDAFRSALQAEISRSKFFGRKFALAVVRSLGDADAHLRHWCIRVREALRPVDRVAFYSHETVEILLPEVTSDQAMELARAVVASAGGDPTLVCGVALFPDAATTVDKLIEVSHEAARLASRSETVRVAAPEGPLLYVAPKVADSIVSDGDRTGTTPVGNDLEIEGHLLVTRSAAMRALVETAMRASRAAIPVLLNGETGTGKEVLARFLHDRSPRRSGPLICVNCGAIPTLLVESTLFGHEKGAFTGALQQRGVFEAAAGGTVLLDEIGELPAAAQAALLRVLEAKRVTRIGSTKEIEVDVRIIAATHRDLEAMVDAGTFRQDLFYRLNALTLKIPPLRSRRDDIALLVAGFLRQANVANNSNVRGIAPDAVALLESYPWPGNVRELRNAIERAVVIAESDMVTTRDLPERIRTARPTSIPPAPPMPKADIPSAPRAFEQRSSDPAIAVTAPSASGASLRQRLDQIEAELLLDALRDADWNQTEAARRLEVPLRTLQHKIRTYNIKKSYTQGPK